MIDLYLESQRTPLFRFEDIYVTGILSAKTKTKVKLVHKKNFDSKISRRCRHPSQILDHGFSPAEMTEFHEKMNHPEVDMECGASFLGTLFRDISLWGP